jgi:Tfp pilus assembly protein PilX
MAHSKHSSRGFTLIAALLVMVLLSGVAVGLLFMVSSETRMSGNGLENDQAYYGAESGMEKLTADLSSLYTAYMVPTNTQIQALVTNPPSSSMVGSVTYNETITYQTNPLTGAPVSSWNTVSSGADAGLYAEIVPMTLNVSALRPEGAFVNMTRQVEIALIPVFQFGVFCGYDCSYFAGPDFGFAGRVHTNGNLFLADGADLVFSDKVAAFSQIITDRLENGWSTGSGYGGTIYVPKASGGCPLGTPPVFPPTGANCLTLPGPGTIPGDASWSGGYPTIGGAANANFPSISTGTFNGYLANSLTGVTNLQLPFVQNSCTSNPPPCTDPIQIIRKPQPGESPTSAIGSSRLYNKASIRILIADTQADLHPERGPIGDGQDVYFTPGGGAAINAGVTMLNLGGGPVPGPMPYAMALVGTNNWVAPTGFAAWTQYPILGEVTTAAIPNNGQGAWIRVEYLNNAATPVWVGITTDWLGYGFSRQYNQPPTGPAGTGPTATKPGADPYVPDAILMLQQMAPGAFTPTTVNGAYPINFYDTREGEMRDTTNGCAVNGLMNAVELNVANLGYWLAGKAPYSTDVGNTVNYANQNGYILYYSDHRGMLPDPNPTNGGQIAGGTITGESGLEDVINSTQPLTSTTPNGTLEPKTYYTYSPEDADQNGFLDNWGGKNIGYGFGVNTNTAPPNPYLTTNCATTGLSNAVSGARHVLKLVAGGMSPAGVSYLPTLPPAAACTFTATTDCGGFTVASENPVYVQGDYNSSAADPFWTGGSNNVQHSAASIVADSVTLLSSLSSWPVTGATTGWTDLNSLNNFTTMTNRNASTSYYRMAVSGGKNIPFPQPGFGGVANDFGTDGGLHNFLRLLEDWSGVNLNYNGSLVSMYYSEYDTGTFKCCTVVYNAPTRHFYFDTLFLNPNNLPPGTPMFQDIVNLSYHQNFTPQ